MTKDVSVFFQHDDELLDVTDTLNGNGLRILPCLDLPEHMHVIITDDDAALAFICLPRRELEEMLKTAKSGATHVGNGRMS